MEYILGVDGGGTKTTATLYNRNGDILGQFIGGPMNIQLVDEKNIIKLFNEMLTSFGVNAEEVEIGIGAAGAGRKTDIEKLENILKVVGFKIFAVSNDAHIALLATHGKENGMLIISGTGSIGFALKDNVLYRKGGWGHILGDEGSGYFLGLSLVKKVFSCLDDGSKFPTSILNEIYEKTGCRDSSELLRWVYAKEKGEIAKISSIVLKNSNDSICKKIINEAVGDLKNLVINLKKDTDLIEVGFAGGIIENDTLIRRQLVHELNSIGIKVVKRKYSNEYGATLLL